MFADDNLDNLPSDITNTDEDIEFQEDTLLATVEAEEPVEVVETLNEVEDVETASSVEEVTFDKMDAEPVVDAVEEEIEVEPEEVIVETQQPTAQASSGVSEEPVTVQPIKFAAFDELKNKLGDTNQNLNILLDIKLKLTVELGRTTLPIKKVLELTRGSIIELEKAAGEPVELLANGKLIAQGEVVVIEDNFGLRITNITPPDERLKSAQ